MMDQASKMLNVTAEATAFIVTESGKKTPLVQLTGPFGLGTPYLTLIMTGPNKNDMQVYAHAFAGNEQQDEGLVLLEEASYTNLRVVHLRPNAEVDKGDKLDIYLNRATVSDAKVADTLNYRYASRDFGPLFADSFRLKFVPPGESPSTSVLTVDQRLGNDTSYVVILTQFTDLKPTPMILTRTPVNPLPPGLGSSLIRFANAAPFHTPLTVVVTYGEDTIRFEDVAFKAATEFRSIATGQPLSIEVFRQGQEMPFFTAGSAQVSVPVGSYLTVIASGNEQGFTAQMLNESQSGLQPLTSFDPISSVAFEGVTHNYELKSVPNPASDQARLSFQLERSGRVTVSLYDAMGRLLEAVPSRNFEVGEASLELNTGHLVPGMYTCVLQGDDGSVETVKIMVAR